VAPDARVVLVGESTARPSWEHPCIERAKRGERAAFAELYRAYAPPLFARVLMPRLGDRAAAEDALSETFRTVFERIADFDDQGVSIWHWIARIGSNKANDMHRVRSRTGRALASFEELLAPLLPEVERPGERAEREATALVLRERVVAVLERLNPRYRQAIELRFFEERSREECAAAMDAKLGTFDVVMLRALRAFRKEWTESVGGSPEEAQ
jgi:RNA polymerase sigma-70 factor (ECF subfamily)